MNRLLLWDIESSDLTGDFGKIFCIGYKWLHEKEVKVISCLDKPTACLSLHDGGGWEKGLWSDKYVVSEFKKVLDTADVQVTWYGKRFDFPMLQTRLIANGCQPVAPIPHIDGYDIARYRMRLKSNRLQRLCDFLKLEDKTALKPGVWVDAHTGHIPSIKYIIKHCKQDVKVLEDVYKEIRHLGVNLPSLNLGMGACGHCGKENALTKQGTRVTVKYRYQQFKCRFCGAWTQGKQIKEVS